MRYRNTKGEEKRLIDTHIGHPGDAIRLITEMLEKTGRKDGGCVADIKAGLEALLDAIQREII
jgi:hypothetical protein